MINPNEDCFRNQNRRSYYWDSANHCKHAHQIPCKIRKVKLFIRPIEQMSKVQTICAQHFGICLIGRMNNLALRILYEIWWACLQGYTKSLWILSGSWSAKGVKSKSICLVPSSYDKICFSLLPASTTIVTKLIKVKEEQSGWWLR